jgi:hypothetical protein
LSGSPDSSITIGDHGSGTAAGVGDGRTARPSSADAHLRSGSGSSGGGRGGAPSPGFMSAPVSPAVQRRAGSVSNLRSELAADVMSGAVLLPAEIAHVSRDAKSPWRRNRSSTMSGSSPMLQSAMIAAGMRRYNESNATLASAATVGDSGSQSGADVAAGGSMGSVGSGGREGSDEAGTGLPPSPTSGRRMTVIAGADFSPSLRRALNARRASVSPLAAGGDGVPSVPLPSVDGEGERLAVEEVGAVRAGGSQSRSRASSVSSVRGAVGGMESGTIEGQMQRRSTQRLRVVDDELVPLGVGGVEFERRRGSASTSPVPSPSPTLSRRSGGTGSGSPMVLPWSVAGSR